MAPNVTLITLGIALIGGIIPAFIWLWFWLKEDRLHPEPKWMICFTFLGGVVATAFAYPAEKFIAGINLQGEFALLLSWAIVEEVLKLFFVAIIALQSRHYDEPIDAVIYMITGALGFAALENGLFLLDPLTGGDISSGIILGNFRFVGATLLHVACSATIGIFIALAWKRSRLYLTASVLVGLYIAVLLHTLFNFTIIRSEGDHLYLTFSILWTVVVAILFVAERIKHIREPDSRLRPSTPLTPAPLIVNN